MEKYICTVCGYIYDPAEGDHGNLPPNTPWEQVPEDWTCPVCGVGKELFEMQAYGKPLPEMAAAFLTGGFMFPVSTGP